MPEESISFVPQQARNGRGLVLGIALSVLALGFGLIWLTTGHVADPLTWVCLLAGLAMLGIAWSIHRGDQTVMDFQVGPDAVGRTRPPRTAFELAWSEIRTSRLVHEHYNNTVWLEVEPMRPGLFERLPALAFYKTKTQLPNEPERYRILLNDGTDQLDEVDAALRRFGGRRYEGRTAATIKDDQERRRRRRLPLQPRPFG